MAKMTKAQKKRMVKDIKSKTSKLFIEPLSLTGTSVIVTTNDMAAIEKLCAKWMKRIG